MLRRPLLEISRSRTAKRVVTSVPATSGIVARYVAGERVEDAIVTAGRLTGAGLLVSLDHLGEHTTDREQADQAAIACVDLLDRLRDVGLADRCEVSVKLTALGLGLGADGPYIALENAELVCGAACNAGTTVTVDMEDHTTTDATLAVVADLRKDFPQTGAVLQAYLRRTAGDCHDLAYAGSRIRLCKGAYDEPAGVAFHDAEQIDSSYRRCLEILLDGGAYPMIATHDPELIGAAETMLPLWHRGADTYEFQMLFGIRPAEQHRLVNSGHRVRVYVPYGTDWYGYLIRRMAEKPANLGLFVKSLVSRS